MLRSAQIQLKIRNLKVCNKNHKFAKVNHKNHFCQKGGKNNKQIKIHVHPCNRAKVILYKIVSQIIKEKFIKDILVKQQIRIRVIVEMWLLRHRNPFILIIQLNRAR